MDSEVGRTLAELERKLHELERALSAKPTRSGPVPQGTQPPPSPQRPPSPPPPPQTSGARLVDEELSERPAPVEPRPAAPAGESAPPVVRAREVTPPATPAAGDAPGRTAGETAPPATPRPAEESIELGELIRFRDKLTRMLNDLVEDYTKIVTLRKADPGRAAQRDAGDDAP